MEDYGMFWVKIGVLKFLKITFFVIIKIKPTSSMKAIFLMDLKVQSSQSPLFIPGFSSLPPSAQETVVILTSSFIKITENLLK